MNCVPILKNKANGSVVFFVDDSMFFIVYDGGWESKMLMCTPAEPMIISLIGKCRPEDLEDIEDPSEVRDDILEFASNYVQENEDAIYNKYKDFKTFAGEDEINENAEDIMIAKKENKFSRPIIKGKDFKAIADAAKNGNPRALGIIEKYGSDGKITQDELDKLVAEFYIPEAEPIKPAEEPEPAVEEAPAEEEIPNPIKDEPAEPEPIALGVSAVEPTTSNLEYSDSADSLESDKPLFTVDISKLLDDDLEGLIDKIDIPDMSFRDFIKNKKKDSLRARKNHDHFAKYDADGRTSYLVGKEDEYAKSFDNKRKDNERKFKDMDGAIGAYIISVDGLPDDGVEMDDAKISQLYDTITDDDGIMGAFGRSWDEEDQEAMRATLLTLVQQYGKANVIAVLNSLKSDNGAFRDFRNGQIDQETKRYGKSLEELLK